MIKLIFYSVLRLEADFGAGGAGDSFVTAFNFCKIFAKWWGNLQALEKFANFAGKINEMTALSNSRISFVMQESQSMQNGSSCHPAIFFFPDIFGQLIR